MPICALPELSTDYVLSAEQIAAYRANGHVCLRGVCSPEEISAYGPVIRDAALRCNPETRPVKERDTYGKAFLQIMNLWLQDGGARRFTLARRFAKIAADLMGVPGVRLYHDQALFKEPGGGPTPWHQDQYYWPLDTSNTITLWMPLVPLRGGIGPMTFASESHRLGYLGEFKISDESDRVFRKLIADRGLRLDSPGEMEAGDATFHSGWTLHGAPRNPTETLREVMTVIYFADGARLLKPDNANRKADLAAWFSGLKPGDLAASEMNPLLYRREG
ncbi:MAG TPA: phytanoyl-CoA dioxygenase family protein [Armatimonadota bacterium]|jgi:ectoine hydroxylase-related dioxygenase (phytanoyl-CoA dioxygenase family)